MLIRTKRQYFDLARQGLAGNAPQTWDTVKDFLLQSSDKLVGLRMLKTGSKKFRAFIPRDKIVSVLKQLNLTEGEYILSKTIGPEEVRLAGELSWMDGRWVFYYSYMKKPMREALAKEGQHAVGCNDVWGLLGQYGTPADIEDLYNLFDRYTHQMINHPVIELTVTQSDCGIFPHRNILIWEVRHY